MNETKHKKKGPIFLIGGRASGKSTLGRLLAQRLSIPFIDMDEQLEEEFGCSVQVFVSKHGWPAFRAKEKELLQQLTQEQDQVIATGGGAILHQDIWPAVKKSGLVVWLDTDPDTIQKRLTEDPMTSHLRPSLTGDDVAREAASVLAAREPLYRQGSHLKLESNDPVEHLVKKLLTRIFHKSRSREAG